MTMERISNEGRTSIVYRVRRGKTTLACKMPRDLPYQELVDEIENAFAVERQLLERLGDHPGIVRYVSISAKYLFLSLGSGTMDLIRLRA
jgi:hypothetical protein